MNKKLHITTLLCIISLASQHHLHAELTVDNFSDIQASENEPFTKHDQACKERIAEEMCNGDLNAIPTTDAILKFIVTLQIFIDKIKDTQNINDETINQARQAVYDLAIARKMLHHTTPADIQMQIRDATRDINMLVIDLEKIVSNRKKELAA